jgi:hypothetical protein
MNLFVEMFDDSEPVQYKAVPTVPDLDFYWLEGATKLSDRQAADKDIRQVVLTELLDGVVGEVPNYEPKAHKVYSSSLVKSIFGGVVVSAPSPTVSTSGSTPQRLTSAQRRKALRQLIQDSGISVGDANKDAIEALVASMEHFVDGNIKAVRSQR